MLWQPILENDSRFLIVFMRLKFRVVRSSGACFLYLDFRVVLELPSEEVRRGDFGMCTRALPLVFSM